MEDNIANAILIELREFRTENEKRWEENNRKWEQNEARWEENNTRWEANDTKWKENDAKLEGMNQRITSLEEGCKKDRKDLLEILDTMQKNIENQFREMKEYFDAKFEKVFVSQRVNDIEHEEFKKLVYTHEDRLNFYNARINQIEEWKEQFHGSQLTVV